MNIYLHDKYGYPGAALVLEVYSNGLYRQLGLWNTGTVSTSYSNYPYPHSEEKII